MIFFKFLNTFIFLTSAIFLVAISPQLSRAENSIESSYSKENLNFESRKKHEINLEALKDWIHEHKILSKGEVGVAYQTRLPVIRGEKKSWAEVSVESRIYSFRAGGDGGMLFPIECYFRVPVSGAGAVEIAQIRAGLLRILGDQVGINLQAFSYLQKTYLNDLGTIRGFEFFELSVVQELSVKGIPYLTLVIKGNASVSLVNLEGVSKNQRRNVESSAGTKHFNSDFGLNDKAGYSIGLRISEKVLIEMSQGFEFSVSEQNEGYESGWPAAGAQRVHYGLRHSYLGAAIRYSPLKAMNILFNVRKDSFEQFAHAEKAKNATHAATDESLSEATSIPYAGVAFELNW